MLNPPWDASWAGSRGFPGFTIDGLPLVPGSISTSPFGLLVAIAGRYFRRSPPLSCKRVTARGRSPHVLGKCSLAVLELRDVLAIPSRSPRWWLLPFPPPHKQGEPPGVRCSGYRPPCMTRSGPLTPAFIFITGTPGCVRTLNLIVTVRGPQCLSSDPPLSLCAGNRESRPGPLVFPPYDWLLDVFFPTLGPVVLSSVRPQLSRVTYPTPF